MLIGSQKVSPFFPNFNTDMEIEIIKKLSVSELLITSSVSKAGLFLSRGELVSRYINKEFILKFNSPKSNLGFFSPFEAKVFKICADTEEACTQDKVDVTTVFDIVTVFKNLSEFSFRANDGFKDFDMKLFSNLKSLSVAYLDGFDGMHNLSRLESLSFINFGNIIDFSPLFDLPNLTKLVVNAAWGLDPFDLTSVQQLTRLKSLTPPSHTNDLKLLSSLTNLTELDLSCFFDTTYNSLKGMSNLKCLKIDQTNDFNFLNTMNIDRLYIKQGSANIDFNNCSSITYLNIQNPNGVNLNFLAGATRLENLVCTRFIGNCDVLSTLKLKKLSIDREVQNSKFFTALTMLEELKFTSNEDRLKRY